MFEFVVFKNVCIVVDIFSCNLANVFSKIITLVVYFN